MEEVNYRVSTSTAYTTWQKRWHKPNMEDPSYKDLFTDVCYLIQSWNNGEVPGDKTQVALVNDIAQRIFYILSTSDKATLPMVTLVSKLDADCQALSEDYEENMQLYADMVYALRPARIFTYYVTAMGAPVLVPTIKVKGELRQELDSKFGSALPQLGGVVGELGPKGFGLIPGVAFSGKSTKRKTPLNQQDREIVSLISQQQYWVDMAIVDFMPYFVPSITDTGLPISEQEQEDARTAYERFVEVAEQMHALDTTIQFPTTQDSRGRFYNMATDPAIRLSLRSIKYEGNLTEFELEHLTR